MIAVIFEVWPKAGHKQDYLAMAKEMRRLVASVDGFVSVERFESIYEPGKLLSLSFFEDEAAVEAWRNTVEHRAAQAMGRHEYFENYRLRIAHVLRDYGMTDRERAPVDSRGYHG